jgi:hypothetical protein
VDDRTFQYQAHLVHTQSHSMTIYSDGERFNEQGSPIVITDENSLAAAPFKMVKRCPYCGTSLDADTRSYSPHVPPSYQDIDWYGARCHRCNWWLVQKRDKEDNDITDVFCDELTMYEGIVAKFDPTVWREPLARVDAEISEYRKALDQLAPHQVEVLVGQLLSQYLNCDVLHVGRSHDKGIDLILLRADANIAVQVKHRLSTRKAGSEGVRPVREFVGALVTEGYKEGGMLVTTDVRFSRDAEECATKASREWAPVNLVTVRQIQEFMGTFKSNQWLEFETIWEQAQRDPWD